jgi:enoyl-CoA hydratase/carnithine racemase
MSIAVASVQVSLDAGTHVGIVTFSQGGENRIDIALLDELIAGLTRLVSEGARAIVLRSGSKHFCAGVDVQRRAGPSGGRHLYDAVPALFAVPVPLVAAVDGSAVGAGLGLAVAADFRVATPGARFWANFTRLGFSPGFALSATLPRLIGVQRAAEMLYTGRRIDGVEAERIGLVDRLVEGELLDEAASELAAELAASAPLAVAAVRRTLRSGLLAEVEATLTAERGDQEKLMRTADFAEGLRAARDRRRPEFQGR